MYSCSDLSATYLLELRTRGYAWNQSGVVVEDNLVNKHTDLSPHSLS